MKPELVKELQKIADPAKAEILQKFFKTHPGGYGEGDQFLGVSVPLQRKIAQKYYHQTNRNELETLMQSPWHEVRLTALFILIHKLNRGGESQMEEWVNLYLDNLDQINNWDLVDASAYKILGPFLFLNPDRVNLIDQLIQSGDLWRIRIAVISTFYFIKRGKFELTLRISAQLLDHPHDLIHKAVGWMLREIGNRDRDVEEQFLQSHYHQMPRTMLRYAIEKFPQNRRKAYLQGLV